MNPETDERPRILCVDDEPNLLEGLSRQLRKQFQVSTAPGGIEGLVALQKEAPFAIVVSDMRMPAMSGAEFLKRVMQRSPNTVRILLTGQTELSAAISAVNDANIFRFLTKPCPPETLLAALEAGMKQHQLILSEQVLLGKTLYGCIQALTDILALAQPAAFGRAVRIKTLAGALAEKLGEKRWPVEVAAMLAPIGIMTLPPATAEKYEKGIALSAAEEIVVNRLPAIAMKILSPIPRLDAVFAVLEPLGKSTGPMAMAGQWKDFPLGTRILAVAHDYEAWESQVTNSAAAFMKLTERPDIYDPQVLKLLDELMINLPVQEETLQLALKEIKEGMVFAQDVLTRTGMLLVARGQSASENTLTRIHNFSSSVGIKEPIMVTVKRVGRPLLELVRH